MPKNKKAKLNEAVNFRKDKTKAILERIKSVMNQGQFKKLMQDTEVKEFFVLHGVIKDGDADG